MARYALDPRWIVAKFNSTCDCHAPIRKGEKVFFYPNGRRCLCVKCSEAAAQTFAAAAADDAYAAAAAAYAAAYADAYARKKFNVETCNYIRKHFKFQGCKTRILKITTTEKVVK